MPYGKLLKIILNKNGGNIINFFEAVESMKRGIPVESLVSYTTYQMSKEGLLAEGLVVPFEHLTVQEANGEWREVNIVETMEEFNQLTDEQKSQILDEAIKHFDFHEKHRQG
jgi:hypothetical protein